MRVATFLSAAAIAAAASIGPALAYGPAASGPSHSYLTSGPEAASTKAANQQTQVAFAIIKKGTNGYYVLVKGDNGKEFPNCDERANCSITIGEEDFVGNGIGIDCASAGGCVMTGKK
jgi:hypothetical protein